MEKKNGEATLEKLIMAEDELRKCKREFDLLKEQLAREETDRRVWMQRSEEDEKLRAARFREEQRESEERERKWKEMYEKLREDLEKVEMDKARLSCRVSALECEKKKAEREAEEDKNVRVARFREDQRESAEREKKWKERYQKLWEDFEKVDKEKAKLECRVSALEFEKAKAEEYNRRLEDLNRRISQLEEDAALLMSAGLEERRGEEMGPVAETTDEIFNELVTDGNEGVSNGEGSGNENVNELLVKVELNCCENAESLSRGGGSAPGTGEVGSSHRENGPMVIEIDDSDDEMPTRKRSLFTDDNDDAKPNKKCHTKPIQQLDLPDDSDSSDSEDSASSDSFIDSKSEIARLNRKLAGDKTWAFKADMMAALNREPELCMNAVCALYRKQGKVESFSGSSFNINQGFNQFDALRGTNLGKYLTGGDPQGKLKRSVSELQEFDSNGLKDCKKFALHYSDQLYEIYQKKQDAFFLPP